MKIKIAIASNNRFLTKTFDVFYSSLINASVPPEDIYIFNSGFEKRKDFKIGKSTYVELEHNSFEYSPLIDIVENKIESEYWFLMHDTCKVGKNLYKLLIEKSNIFVNPLKIALKNKPSMSIGLYSYEYLLIHSIKIISLKNKDYSLDGLQKQKQWGIDAEDYILWMTEGQTENYTPKNNFETINCDNWYGEKTHRIVEYYCELDLYKAKSNWTPKKWMELNL